MCYYEQTICESCKAVSTGSPVFCDKIKAGVICTKFDGADSTFVGLVCKGMYDETRNEVRLYDILTCFTRWVDYTFCSCGLSYMDITGTYCTARPHSCTSSCIDEEYDDSIFDITDPGDIDFDLLWKEIHQEMSSYELAQ
jgi:hypothetical protein